MLRIGQLRLSGVHAEESGVELVHAVEHRAGLDEVGRFKDRRIKPVFQLVVGEERNALDAVTQIAPECRHAPGRPESARPCRRSRSGLRFPGRSSAPALLAAGPHAAQRQGRTSRAFGR